MENFETKSPAPLWYKIIIGLWGPFSLIGGGAVAFYIIQESPSKTMLIGSIANAVQVVLLGLLLNQGLKYYSAKQLAKKFLLVFLLLAIIPIILVIINSGGEVSLGMLMFIVLLAISIPQIIYTGLYGLSRKIFKSSSYTALVVSAVVHVLIFSLIFGFLFQS